MKISDIISTLLQQTGMIQEDLADRLGVSRQAMSAWLRSDSEPRPTKRRQVEEYYLEVVGRDHVGDELISAAITEAEKCQLTVQELLGSTAVLNKMIVQMTYHTNSIEGSTMTVTDNQAVLLYDRVLTNRSAREQSEARNHRAAFLWLLDRIEDGNFTWNEELAQSLHVRVMNGLVLEAGAYRTHGVRIPGTRVAVANYLKIAELMQELFCRPMPESFAEMAEFHADFEKIHPFSDGNGRVGRLLIAACALHQGLVPPIIERERQAAYYHSLELAQTSEKYQPLTYLLARETVVAAELVGLMRVS